MSEMGGRKGDEWQVRRSAVKREKGGWEIGG
jgi:hypothetical protein